MKVISDQAMTLVGGKKMRIPSRGGKGVYVSREGRNHRTEKGEHSH